ncbi:hypothetical protein AURDEDRAFT_125048 [Auricularia subglabra TFB-10046 SS5]|nr:hypothetical protein AURDEDRAFT_125048 [Auricularia subglabra TFB-10046 SS5]
MTLSSRSRLETLARPTAFGIDNVKAKNRRSRVRSPRRASALDYRRRVQHQGIAVQDAAFGIDNVKAKNRHSRARSPRRASALDYRRRVQHQGIAAQDAAFGINNVKAKNQNSRVDFGIDNVKAKNTCRADAAQCKTSLRSTAQASDAWRNRRLESTQQLKGHAPGNQAALQRARAPPADHHQSTAVPHHATRTPHAVVYKLRALMHRSTSLSLRRQMANVSGGRVFTTQGIEPRVNVDDPVELEDDEEDEEPPVAPAKDPAREARLTGDLSDCSEPEDEPEDEPEEASEPPTPLSPCSAWESEGTAPPAALRWGRKANGVLPDEYPLQDRVLSHPLAQVLQDAQAWRDAREQRAQADAPPSLPAKVTAKKKVRRGGRVSKSRTHWTEAQRQAEKGSVAYANRTASVRAMRQNQRLVERHDAAPPVAEKHVDDAQQYASSFKLATAASNRSPFVAARLAPAGASGTTSPVYRAGFSRVGISPASKSNARWVLRQALGPPAGCDAYVCDLVKSRGFTYVPNASCAQVFTDEDGLIYAVKVAQPSGEQWDATVKYFAAYLHKLRDELRLSHAANVNHLRGDFVRMTWGTSHGGGRKVRAVAR